MIVRIAGGTTADTTGPSPDALGSVSLIRPKSLGKRTANNRFWCTSIHGKSSLLFWGSTCVDDHTLRGHLS